MPPSASRVRARSIAGRCAWPTAWSATRRARRGWRSCSAGSSPVSADRAGSRSAGRGARSPSTVRASMRMSRRSHRPGSELHIGSAEHGIRFVLAVRGGFDVPAVLGSRSTRLSSSGSGPHPVTQGSVLPIGAEPHAAVPLLDFVPVPAARRRGRDRARPAADRVPTGSPPPRSTRSSSVRGRCPWRRTASERGSRRSAVRRTSPAAHPSRRSCSSGP